ncbi:Protein kinase domain [Carpediemonas membranifera]|uniref:non-specific serine/threonine protein kinase n=1 Tax=Carpediemonas membranifera TaxID=201153 RepID=A0A8J6AYG7_9EUKA|nr:Protein kinase domain [Carpediemonas membranifera]|eukprot:KAG9391518.1 Protein kinase domain [Carpediemonas membranifera]
METPDNSVAIGEIDKNLLLKKRFRLVRQIGSGAFGSVYVAVDVLTARKFAVKMEARDAHKTSVLSVELGVLRKLKNHSRCIPSYVCCGTTQHHHYIVMKLLGPDLSALRRKMPAKKFSLSTTLRLGVAMVDCLEVLHTNGYIHRDVKPSNFVMARHSSRLYIIDFGIARKYTDAMGFALPPRQDVGFRGTARYAPVAAHQRLDLACRDDYWSLLFLLIDLYTGKLPWSGIKDRGEIGEAKTLAIDSGSLIEGLPHCFTQLMHYIQAVKFIEPVDHDYVRQLFLDQMQANGIAQDTPYDWESEATQPTATSESSGDFSQGMPKEPQKANQEKPAQSAHTQPGISINTQAAIQHSRAEAEPSPGSGQVTPHSQRMGQHVEPHSPMRVPPRTRGRKEVAEDDAESILSLSASARSGPSFLASTRSGVSNINFGDTDQSGLRAESISRFSLASTNAIDGVTPRTLESDPGRGSSSLNPTPSESRSHVPPRTDSDNPGLVKSVWQATKGALLSCFADCQNLAPI